MKFVKLSIFALTMGLFIASCGGNGGEVKTEDTTATAPMATTPAPTTPDTAMAAAAMDTAHAAMDTAKAATAAKH